MAAIMVGTRVMISPSARRMWGCWMFGTVREVARVIGCPTVYAVADDRTGAEVILDRGDITYRHGVPQPSAPRRTRRVRLPVPPSADSIPRL